MHFNSVVAAVVVAVVVADFVVVNEDEMPLSRRIRFVRCQDLLASHPFIP